MLACASPHDSNIAGEQAVTDAGAVIEGPATVDASEPLTVAGCFQGSFVNERPLRLDYDQFNPVLGSHCVGTNHQDIAGIERVVFLGDSVTAGSPPTTAKQFYRSRLADSLAARFALDPPSETWKSVNMFGGYPVIAHSGDFSACPQWGARTNDLLDPQIDSCFSDESRELKTLVVFTMGGNDIAKLTKDGMDGVSHDALWEDVHLFVQKLRDTLAWFREPGRFPGGVYIVYANMFEFTDGTGDTSACPAAELAGFEGEWDDPHALADMVVFANEQYLKAAVDYQADMMFMLETFCGHGFNRDDEAGDCYRGPGTARWFDDTCMHPNPLGHQQIADMFEKIIAE